MHAHIGWEPFRFPPTGLVLCQTSQSLGQVQVVPKEKGKQSWFKSLSVSLSLKKKARACFACPVTFNIPQHDSGEYKGYEMDLPSDWVQKYGPTILMALKITQVALAAGRLTGLPLPNLDEAGKAIKAVTKSSHLADVKEFMEELVENEQVQELIESNDILSIGNDVLSGEKTVTEGIEEAKEKVEDSLSRSPKTHQVIEQSMEHVKKIAKDDEDFQKSGLVYVEGKDGCTEYVHPYIAPFFEEHGKKCFEMPPDKIQEVYWKAHTIKQTKGPQVVCAKPIVFVKALGNKSRFGVLLEDRSLQCFKNKLSYDNKTDPEKIVLIRDLSWTKGPKKMLLSRQEGKDKTILFEKEEDAKEWYEAWSSKMK